MYYYIVIDEGLWCKGYNFIIVLIICKDYKGLFSYYYILDFFLDFILF